MHDTINNYYFDYFGFITYKLIISDIFLLMLIFWTNKKFYQSLCNRTWLAAEESCGIYDINLLKQLRKNRSIIFL